MYNGVWMRSPYLLANMGYMNCSFTDAMGGWHCLMHIFLINNKFRDLFLPTVIYFCSLCKIPNLYLLPVFSQVLGPLLIDYMMLFLY